MRNFLLTTIVAPTLVFAAGTKFETTHRQAFILKPAKAEMQITLSAFTMDAAGNVVAAIRSDKRSGSDAGWQQIYGPDKALVREIALPFPPTAVAVTGDGHFLAAGGGKMCKTTPEGAIVEKGDLTTLLKLDPKKLREEAIAEWRKDQIEFGDMKRNQRTVITGQIGRMEKKAEAERTDRDKARLASLKAQLAGLPEEGKEKDPPEEEIASVISHRMYIPSIAATANGALITLNKNRGYEVWQTDAKFAEGKQIITGLRGCCGQMDVTTAGDRIFTAENTKYQVGVYDLAGKAVMRFGEEYKDGNNGFGSCCNPMNVTPLANGDVLTAESSIGHIKRFNSEGKLVGVIGRARIGGGCKHVSLGFDPKRDRYYVQYEDLNHICVMLPNAEAVPFVAEQDKAKADAEVELAKLVGKWKARGPNAKNKKGLLGGLFGGISDSGSELSAFDFRADHSMMIREGDKGFRRWVATGVENGKITMEVEEADGYVDFVAEIVVKDADTIELTADQNTTVYRREIASK